ncbi:atherin-like [Cyanistes caeruleus]|uniref:atherin-like n=1 Tax=Cyanistes caeruleus TaxID=156563 RepID=UPI000CDB6F0D|nr:atherin-like [Cyanistes caeruleus]
MQVHMYLTKGEKGRQNYTSVLKGFFGTSEKEEKEEEEEEEKEEEAPAAAAASVTSSAGAAAAPTLAILPVGAARAASRCPRAARALALPSRRPLPLPSRPVPRSRQWDRGGGGETPLSPPPPFLPFLPPAPPPRSPPRRRNRLLRHHLQPVPPRKFPVSIVSKERQSGEMENFRGAVVAPEKCIDLQNKEQYRVMAKLPT